MHTLQFSVGKSDSLNRATLNEPHIDKLNVRNPYIMMVVGNSVVLVWLHKISVLIKGFISNFS